ncbi:MAG: PKD domain-containing protein [Burkholderiales bacterium]
MTDPTTGDQWTIRLAIPGGGPLVQGAYAEAESNFNQTSLRPALSVEVGGRACKRVFGKFAIYEVAYAPNGHIAALAVDFEQRCERIDAPFLRGVVRFYSGVPLQQNTPIALAGIRSAATENSLVILDGSGSFSMHSEIAGYRWRQLSGPPVVLEGATTPRPYFRAPGVGDTAQALRFEIEVADRDGARSTNTTSVIVSPRDWPVTRLFLAGSVLDPVSQGETVLLSSLDARFTTLRHSDGSIQIKIDAGQSWSLRLAPPMFGSLQTGRYDSATSARFSNQSAGPGIDFSGIGRTCVQSFGGFAILEIAISAEGELDRLAVDFEQHCEHPAAGALVGAIRVNASSGIPPSARIDGPRIVASGTSVALSAAGSFDSDGWLTRRIWTQLSGPVATLTTSDSALTGFVAPTRTGASQHLVFALSVSDNQGNVDTTTAEVVVSPGVDSEQSSSIPITTPGVITVLPEKSAADSSGGKEEAKGGGGCVVNGSGAPDPTLLILVLLAVARSVVGRFSRPR